MHKVAMANSAHFPAHILAALLEDFRDIAQNDYCCYLAADGTLNSIECCNSDVYRKLNIAQRMERSYKFLQSSGKAEGY